MALQTVRNTTVSTSKGSSFFGWSLTQGAVDALVANGISMTAIASLYGITLGALKAKRKWWDGEETNARRENVTKMSQKIAEYSMRAMLNGDKQFKAAAKGRKTTKGKKKKKTSRAA